ncbi:MAG: histidine phosphatase family protein [Chloroflexota bacterium]|nr:histidine phosphatase family protein [Chloroflexota bacterium]
METTIYLMRHGQVHNPTNVLYGRRPGFALSEAGIQQAHAAGKCLADHTVSAIYSSPMERARQTAEIVASYHSAVDPRVDRRLIEVATPYEGRPIAELAAMGWDLYTGNQPPHEIPQMVLDRVLDFFDYARKAHRGKSIIAVGHGDVLVFPWLHAHGFAPEALMKDNLMNHMLPVDYPATASIMTFIFDESPGGAALRATYVCPY